MKLLILSFLFSLSATAGVGGIDGGSVHFQKDSTWVNMVYSKSLCFKDSQYFAKSRKCTGWERSSDERRCKKHKIAQIVQPMHSTRQRCKKMEEEGCKEWETIKYVQKRDRLVKFKDEDDNVVRVEKLRVKGCQ